MNPLESLAHRVAAATAIDTVADPARSSAHDKLVDPPALDALLSYPLRDRLGAIVCPTLIVWGDRDQIVPVSDAHRFERLIPGSRKVILPDTGHVTMLERPLIFNGLLQSFLAE